MRCKYFLTLILVAIMPLTIISQISNQPKQFRKSALVIGNGNYPISVLANPENDARDMETILKKLGFIVFKYVNLNQNQMKKAIDEFGLKLKDFDVGLFYYAGHGIQSNGYNYLIPIDAPLITEKQVEYDCVQADRILALMEGSGTNVNIIILDACRNNPFERSWTRSSTGRGLAFMNAPSGTLIAYSTAPGTTAQDGSGNNSPYTAAILESIQIPGISITQMFQNVTRLVTQKSGNRQIPWISSSLTGDFYFNINGIVDYDFQNSFNKEISETPLDIISNNSSLDYIENRGYKTVRIGNQVWMAENLKTTRYNDGTAIPLITDDKVWRDLTTPGYCWYKNDQSAYGNIYGPLYNWYAINTNKLCPIGWHIPTDKEWSILTTYLGGANLAGDKLKETGTAHWNSPNAGATNETGFTALPGGCRDESGTFYSLVNYGYWWSSTENSYTDAWCRTKSCNYGMVYRDVYDKKAGLSVRCVKD